MTLLLNNRKKNRLQSRFTVIDGHIETFYPVYTCISPVWAPGLCRKIKQYVCRGINFCILLN